MLGRPFEKIEQINDGLSGFLSEPAIALSGGPLVFIILQTAVGSLNKHNMRVLAKHQAYAECACHRYGRIVDGFINPVTKKVREATDSCVRSICGLPDDKEKANKLFAERFWPEVPRLKTGRINDHICDAGIAAYALKLKSE